MSKRKPDEVKKGLDEWMGTYGDLVTLLLCFFILLFAMSSIDADKFKAMAASFSTAPDTITKDTSEGILNALGNGIVEMPKVEGDSDKENEEYKEGVAELKQMASDFRTYFAQNNYSNKIDVVNNDKFLTLNFKDGILYDSGSADLKSSALQALSMVAEELLKYPENDITIEGHTDNRPINNVRFPNNWYLSAARAISVAMYFTDVKDFPEKRISTTGYGEYRPISTNDTADGRSANRRVEIKILSKYYSNKENNN